MHLDHHINVYWKAFIKVHINIIITVHKYAHTTIQINFHLVYLINIRLQVFLNINPNIHMNIHTNVYLIDINAYISVLINVQNVIYIMYIHECSKVAIVQLKMFSFVKKQYNSIMILLNINVIADINLE